MASQSIAAFTDFSTLYPDDKRGPEVQQKMDALRVEQARGSYEIARYYERRGKRAAALIYYNEVLVKDSKSSFAEDARQRIDSIRKLQQRK